MLYLNSVDFLTLRGSLGLYLNHVLPPRPSKSYGVVVVLGGPKDFTDRVQIPFSLLGFGAETLDLALDSGLSLKGEGSSPNNLEQNKVSCSQAYVSEVQSLNTTS